MTRADWIAVDWGTSRIRAWALSESGEVLARAQSDQGMGQLVSEEFEPVLLRLVGDWLSNACTTPVIACGMVGARQGWVEAQYRKTPCSPGEHLTAAPVRDPRLQVHICAGLKQMSPADVMRGEETQVAGLLTMRPQFEGVLCLPGTHSKWVCVDHGKVTEFQTFMTGELYALLAGQSVLRYTVGSEDWDDEAFCRAVEAAVARPGMIAARLFALRAEALIADLGPKTARSRLSGYLIGLELGASRPHWDAGRPVAIIGTSLLAHHYSNGLRLFGLTTELLDSETMTLNGLAACYRTLNGH
ncbi:2-dehydro-3-deoxygalactonokinase [Marinobacter alexandrii]|uniref:2-dehydro-3-deoxygalactonokinase n=2 Tax=Marinobacter alexandrii TaxID=2570351 RepID=UPI003265C664